MSAIASRDKLQLAQRILLDRELAPIARLVGIHIANHLSTQRGYAWPPQEKIAVDLGIDERSVRRAIGQLGAHFVVDCSRRQHEYRMRTIPDTEVPNGHIDTGHLCSDTGQECTPKPDTDVPPYLLDTSNHNICAVADATRTDSKPREEGKRNSRKEDSDTSSVSTSFNEFWKAKPSRGKAANPKHPAALKFAAAVKAGADPQQIIAAAKQWASAEAENKNIGTAYVAMAVTWLHQRRFEDYQAPPTAAAQSRFDLPPESPQFKAWLAYAECTGKRAFQRLLEQRQLEGRTFNFESEWPPGYGPTLKVVGASLSA